jgi:hypothetical protein
VKGGKKSAATENAKLLSLRAVTCHLYRKGCGDHKNRKNCTVASIMFRKCRREYTNRMKYTVDSITFRKVRGDYTKRTKYTLDSITFRKVRGDYTDSTHYTVGSISGRDIEPFPLFSQPNRVWGPRHLPSQWVRVTSVLCKGTTDRG